MVALFFNKCFVYTEQINGKGFIYRHVQKFLEKRKMDRIFDYVALLADLIMLSY